MAKLNLIKTDDGNYYLQGVGDPSPNADFSVFDWDGEGGDPFALVCGRTWEIVSLPGIKNAGVAYRPEDSDSFWAAQAKIVAAAKRAGIEVPEYADE